MADIFKILGKTGHIYTDYEKTNKPDGFSFNQQYEVIGSHTFTEGQQVVLGVDYEKGYKGWNFIEQKWEDVTQEDYEHLLDPARCIIAKPLPVNQSVNEEKDGAILGWGTKENVQSVMGEEVKRYFFFSYKFDCSTKSGYGSCWFVSNGFPQASKVKEVCRAEINKEYQSLMGISIVITGFQELSKSDYESWIK